MPANYALTAPELGYIVGQCGARALFHDPALSAADGQDAPLRGTLAEGAGALDALAAALDPSLDGLGEPPPDEGLADTDLVQIIYTSGTTGAPKGAMMTHRAYLFEYMGAAAALDYSPEDRALAALPLYHTAQMHAFTMPQLLVGAETLVIEAPEPARVLELIERERHHLLLRPAHGLDRPAAPPGLRPARPFLPEARLLRRGHHAGAGAARAAATPARRPALPGLRPERDRAAGDRAAAGGPRRAAPPPSGARS